jgi:hypothetical protein
MPEAPFQRRVQRRAKPLCIAFAAAIYTLLCIYLFIRIRHATGGHVLFTLDDPYIHLALSQQIAAGHYGINPGEAVSPSSSILWPLLLALFAHVSWQPMAALVLNFLAGLASAALIGSIVAAWPRKTTGLQDAVPRILAILALLFLGNLVGLTFLGMEHTLQALLAVLCAMGLIAATEGRPIPAWCLAAAVLAPLVRYEDLTLTLAVAICLVGQRRPGRAAALCIATVTPLAAFSLFLHHLGLPLLPISVLFKGGIPIQGGTFASRLLTMLKIKQQYLTEWPDRILLLVLCLILMALAIAARGSSQRDRSCRFAYAGAAAAAFAHFLLGPFGWFHRYEVYILLFSAILILAAVAQRPTLLAACAALLLACAYPSLITTRQTVAAAQDTYQQQYQMHRFLTGFASGNVAVNDLGLVAYDRRPHQYVLDLVGLGSLESVRAPHKDAAWLDAITREHDIRIVIIYRLPWLFPNLPSTWTVLGTLCTNHPPITVAAPCVTYFATPLADASQLRAQFAAFTQTLPPEVTLQPPTP